MPTIFHVMVSRIRAFFRPGDLDRDFDQELATHLSMAEDDNMRRGMTLEQARRAARVELGALTQLRESGREARGLPWLGTFWLDVKLGLRMLRKSWGLTLVGGLSMTVVIGIALLAFISFQIMRGGTLPLDEGERVVGIWPEVSLKNFERWRDTLGLLEDVGAFQTIELGLAIADGPAEPVSVAEMTASGFGLARVPPLLGRPLIAADEHEGAIPVVVIGYDLWQSRFFADPAVVGMHVRLGGTDHTVVGVMPEDFGFPVNHRLWTPLRSDPTNDVPDQGPEVFVFARLAAGATLKGAQAELTTVGPTPTDVPDTGESLQPRLLPYRDARIPPLPFGDRIIRFLVTLLLIPPLANIAILVYARTVTRGEEFAARYALGASRGRLIGQLFVEALVLAAGAAGVALVFLRLWMLHELSISNSIQPFWFDLGFSYMTILFAGGLAVIAALIVGVVPAHRATGRLVQTGLRALDSRTGIQLGAMWTVLVVAQIGFSVAALPVAFEMTWGLLRPGILGPGFAPEEVLTARLMMDGEIAPGAEAGQSQFATRFGALQVELVRQLGAEPGVSRVTVSAAVPGDEPSALVEVEGLEGTFSRTVVQVNRVDDVFFDVFDVRLMAGRQFDGGDHTRERAVVIVNRTFFQDYVSAPNPLGRRVRYVRTQGGMASESGSWYEIVGVVDDLPANTNTRRMYHPLAPGGAHPVSLALRVEPTANSVAGRLLDMTTSLDPALRIEEVLGLDEIYRDLAAGPRVAAAIMGAVTLSVLLLSVAGLYALMSFAVNQRRREIGIRSALGAQPRRLLAAIFRRALGQVAAGFVVGILLALLVDYYLPIEAAGGRNVPGVIPGAAVFMIVVGLLAALGPARRGLRVDPLEALRG